jgi:hypothetical protein
MAGIGTVGLCTTGEVLFRRIRPMRQQLLAQSSPATPRLVHLVLPRRICSNCWNLSSPNESAACLAKSFAIFLGIKCLRCWAFAILVGTLEFPLLVDAEENLCPGCGNWIRVSYEPLQ